MAEFDMHSRVRAAVALNPVTTTATTAVTGTIVDTAGFEALEFMVQAATLGSTLVAIMQDGDDATLSDASVVDPELVLGALPSFAATDDNTIQRVGYIGKKRYVRLVFTPGSSASCTFSANATLGVPHSAPVTDQ